MLLFISGAEIAFIIFIVLLVFGADKIPTIARGLAKGINQVKQATDEIKSEIEKSADLKETKEFTQDITKKINSTKENYSKLTGSIKRSIDK